MKKLLKIILWIIATFLLIIVLLASYVQLKGIPSIPIKMPNHLVSWKVESNVDQIERGSKIALGLCVKCHMNEQGKMTGFLQEDLGTALGEIYSANLTHHKTDGLGAWTDGEIKYLLRTGVNKDGKLVPPFMPTIPRMADRDVDAVIAWLRSDDPMLKATPSQHPKSKPSFLTKALSNFAFKNYQYPENEIHIPDTVDQIAFGRYIADDLMQCYSCHSSSFHTLDELNPPASVGYYHGGNELLDREGNVVPSSSLLPTKGGIADYSEESFIKAVRWGQKRDGKPVTYPMEPYTTLTDYEVGSIYRYLMTMPTPE